MRIEERIARPIALAGGYVLLAQAIITAIEIISRKMFNHSLQGVDELGGYALAITAAVGFGYAVVTRAHTRIDLLIKHLPAPILSVLHVLSGLVMLGVASGMLWFGIRTLLQSIRLGSIATTPLQTPLWLPQSMWVVGLALFFLMALSVSLRSLVLLLRGDFEGVENEMRVQSIEEQEMEASGFGAQAAEERK